MTTGKESDLQRAVLHWLAAHGVLAWRMPIGPVIHHRGPNIAWAKSPLKGFPDIAGVLQRSKPGRFFVIELKSPKGRMTKEQREWIRKLQDAGTMCALVRTIDGLEKVMDAWGEIPKR